MDNHDKPVNSRSGSAARSVLSRRPLGQGHSKTSDSFEDLVWHGGIAQDGCLWVAPILICLQEDTTASQYEKRLRKVLDQSETHELLKTLGWSEIEWQPGVVHFPAIHKVLPLPPAQKIRDLIESHDLAISVKRSLQQFVDKCPKDLEWNTFKVQLLRVRPHPRFGQAETLLDADPGRISLTPTLRSLLRSWIKLCDSLREGETLDQWVVWSRGEISQILSWDFFRQLDARTTLHSKRTWTAFVRSRSKTEACVPGFAADPSSRMDDLSLREMIDNRIPADFDDQAPRTEDVPSWCLLPHFSRKSFQDFIDDVIKTAGAYWIRLGSSSEPLHTLQISYHPLRDFHEEWCASTLDPVIKWSFETLLEHVISQQLYRTIRLAPKNLAAALARRLDPDSLLHLLWAQGASRSIDPDPALIRRRFPQRSGDSSESALPRVSLEPAIMRPSCAATRASSRARKFPSALSQYLSFAEWRLGPPESTTLVNNHEIAQVTVSVPQIHGWFGAEFLWTLTSRPGLFCNTLLLESGRIEIREDHETLLAFGEDEKGASEMTSDLSLRDAYDLLAWNSTIAPWPTLEPSQDMNLKSSKRVLRIIDGGIAAPEIQLASRYESTSGENIKALIGSTRLLLQSVALEARGDAEDHRPERMRAFEEIFKNLSENLTFRSSPYFVVNQIEIPESTWFQAHKVGRDIYVLPDGTRIPEAQYQAFTDLFLARKRVLAKFWDIRLKDLWMVHRETVRNESQAFSPSAYLEQLSLKISPLLDQLDTALIGDLIQHVVKPRIGALSHKLRPYQLTGVAWLYQRLLLGLGVCLADEMGLGKTAQAISLICTARTSEHPALVVVPKSLVINWERELKTFAPNLKVGIYPACDLTTDHDVVLTTYARLRINITELSPITWSLVVLDEAQNIKNRDSLTSQATRQLITSYRVALTGTPIENHAGEIWSLIDWLNPGYLGGQSDFASFVQVARSAKEKQLMLAPLRACLSPLLLRRMKDDPDVALSLPPKIFESLSVSLSTEQELLYRAVLDVVLQEDDGMLSAFARRAAYLKAILHLKQICNHPDIFYGNQSEADILATIDEKDPGITSRIRQVIRSKLRTHEGEKAHSGANDLVQRSGKFAIFQNLVLSLKEQSAGILVFTQYRATAELLCRMLKETAEPTWDDIPFLHGGLSSRERQDMIDAFTASCDQTRLGRKNGDFAACPILILSLKAGGTGLNLTAADRVIHFDRWWNPAVEDQATDRAHRFGQAQTVFVYNLTNSGTIESSISYIFSKKRGLVADFLGKATAPEVSEYLQDRRGFLDLVDPDRRFIPRDDGIAP